MTRLIYFTLVFILALAGALQAQGPPEAPGGGPGGPPMQPGSADRPAPQEMEKRVMEALREVDPDRAQELQALKSSEPEAFQRAFMEVAQRVMMLEQMKRVDPQSYQAAVDEMRLETRVLRVSRKYREAPSDKRAAMEKEMRTLLVAQLEAREAAMRHRIERMESELAQMKKRLEERSKNRASIVDRRLAELTGDPGSEW